MKKALRITSILILTVLILAANTVFCAAAEEEAADMGELLTV